MCAGSGRPVRVISFNGVVTGNWLTIDEAAQRLGQGTDDVLAMVHGGRLPAIPIDGVWHVRSCDVEAIAAAVRTAPRAGFGIASSTTPGEEQRAPSVDLEAYDVDPSLLRLLGRDVCSRLLVLPMSRAGSTLILAMADPTDGVAREKVKSLTGLDIEPVHARRAAVESAIERQYGCTHGVS